MPTKIVIRYANGKVLKGFTRNFSPDRASFNFYPVGGDTTGEGIKIAVSTLKALFFVKDFDGNSRYRDPLEPHHKIPLTGRAIEVEFLDGEVITGTSTGYNSGKPGFFLFPADNNGNNIKVFIPFSAVREVLPAAGPFRSNNAILRS